MRVKLTKEENKAVDTNEEGKKKIIKNYKEPLEKFVEFNSFAC